ncbi:MAG: hypothetical protein AAF564_08435 [Bacteroidota bacterium]
MINTVVTTALAHPNYLSLGALIVSVFFAGSFLQGERVRKQEVKEQLREIQKLADQSMARVDQVQATLAAEDARLVAEISEAYTALAALNEKERVQRLALEETARRNQQLANRRQQNRQQVNESSGFIIDN